MVLQLILTLVFYALLFAILALVGAIWRSSTRHIHRMELLLFDNAAKSADAAKTAAEAARMLAEKKL